MIVVVTVVLVTVVDELVDTAKRKNHFTSLPTYLEIISLVVTEVVVTVVPVVDAVPIVDVVPMFDKKQI